MTQMELVQGLVDYMQIHQPGRPALALRFGMSIDDRSRVTLFPRPHGPNTPDRRR